MSRTLRSRFRPALEVLENRLVPSTVVRPISDFVNDQGTTHAFAPAAVPNLPDVLGWGPAATQSDPLFGLVDFAGRQAAYLQANYGINLHTQTTGVVTDTSLPDGHSRVTVDLFTTNALSWAASLQPDANGSLEGALLRFGVRAAQLVAAHNAGQHLAPALGSSYFHIEFINTAQGAALPDIVNSWMLGNGAPGFQINQISFASAANGAVHDPAGLAPDHAGQLFIAQVGYPSMPTFGPNHDGFPIEKVTII